MHYEEGKEVETEQIVGVIPYLNRKKGFLKYESCDVVVTNSRLIVAIVAKAMRKESRGTSPVEKYQGMAPDAILSETEGNFAIDGSQIKRIRVERGAGGDIETSGGPDRLIIRTTDKKHVFNFATKSISAKDAKAILKQAFGEALT